MNELHLSPEAQADLEEIKVYIAEELENPKAALATVGRITKALRILRTHAFAGAPLSSVADVESDYRFLVSGNYLAFFGSLDGQENTTAYGSIDLNTVYVDRILYGRRDYLRILFGDVETTE